MSPSRSGFTRKNVMDAMRVAGDLARMEPDRLARTEALARGLCRLVGGVIGIVAIVDNFRPEVPWATQVWGMDFGFPREAQRRKFFESLRDPEAMHPLLEAFRTRERRPMAARREDLVADDRWYNSTFWQRYGRHTGIGPMLYTIHPIEVRTPKPRSTSRRAAASEDPMHWRVLGIGIHRLEGSPRFTTQDCELIDACNASLDWFYDELGAPDAPPKSALSPRLQRVLEHLLAGQSEKQVARTIGLTRNTVHEYVKGIYRHFGVGSRAELFARVTQTGGDVAREREGRAEGRRGVAKPTRGSRRAGSGRS